MKTKLSLALAAALGFACAGVYATTNSMPSDPEKLQSMDITQPFGPQAEPLAKRGGTKPEDDGVICDDDHVDNTACVIARRGGTMMEDDDGVDDNGVDPLPHALIQRDGVQVAEKGRGKPEDDGIDADDGFDDNGVDPLPHALIQRDGVQVAEKGRGKPEDDGIDLDDACDNNGIDGMCV